MGVAEQLGYLCFIVESLSHVKLFVTPWTVAHQASLSMGVSRQEYLNGLQCPLPGGLPNPGTELRSPALQVDSLPSEPPGKPLFLSGSLSEPPCPTPLAYIKPKQAFLQRRHTDG